MGFEAGEGPSVANQTHLLARQQRFSTLSPEAAFLPCERKNGASGMLALPLGDCRYVRQALEEIRTQAFVCLVSRLNANCVSDQNASMQIFPDFSGLCLLQTLALTILSLIACSFFPLSLWFYNNCAQFDKGGERWKGMETGW